MTVRYRYENLLFSNPWKKFETCPPPPLTNSWIRAWWYPSCERVNETLPRTCNRNSFHQHFDSASLTCDSPSLTRSSNRAFSASWGVTEEGGLCCCPLLPYSCHNLHTNLCFSSLSVFINYSYPKYDCYICLKYIEEKRHCTTLNKWWADNDMMMLGRNIIVQHHINDGQTMTWWC